MLGRRAQGQGPAAMAAVLLATQDISSAAPAFMERIRPHLPAQAGATVIRPGLLFLRMTAGDSFEF